MTEETATATRPDVKSGDEPAPAGCCGPAQQRSCCEPAAKSACCGDAKAGGCGCR
ncbi:MAG: hypothetical protein ABW221_27505 [Vicinamibacteria bacterium]